MDSVKKAGCPVGNRPHCSRLCPRLESEYSFDFRNGQHDAAFDALLQRHGRYRAGAARASQPELDDAVLFIIIDEFNIATVAAERGADRVEDFLDSGAGCCWHGLNLASAGGRGKGFSHAEGRRGISAPTSPSR